MHVDANSNLTHAGGRLYTGDFGATLRHALPIAVGAPKGQRIRVTGLDNLKPNARYRGGSEDAALFRERRDQARSPK